MAFLEWNNDPTPQQLRWFGAGLMPLFCACAGAWLYATEVNGWLPAALWGAGGLSLMAGWISER